MELTNWPLYESEMVRDNTTFRNPKQKFVINEWNKWIKKMNDRTGHQAKHVIGWEMFVICNRYIYTHTEPTTKTIVYF